jgi:3-hydroxy-9,10-secoandrosta-1,3,5(10)-triene-9,17-dione monooxygenase reductase component
MDVPVAEVTPDAFRQVMGHFVTGVTVVTTWDPADDGRLPLDRLPAGITVNALTSVSLDPPLVVVALDRRRFITPHVHAVGRYAVNILGASQQALSDCFAHAPVTPGREEFCGAAWHLGETGLPLLDGAIATLECTVSGVMSAGDHDLFIGRVDRLSGGPVHDDPLIYYRRHYLRVERSRAEPLEGRPEG